MTGEFTVAYVGLSHLGTCHAVAAHQQGIRVLALDTSEERASQRASGDFDPAEPGIADYLASARDGLVFSSDLDRVREADVVVVALDTRIDAKGTADLSEVRGLVAATIHAMDESSPLVLMSQAQPGFTRPFAAAHENLYYLVETLVFGDALVRALHPERYILGMKNPERLVDPAVTRLLQYGNCPILPMSYESAEITKMSINYMLAASITAANSLADLCEVAGADWGDVQGALRLDKRIGQHAYLVPGLGIGGTNIVRDLVGLKDMGDRLGANSAMTATMLGHSAYSRAWLVRAVSDALEETGGSRLSVLGLAYKPGTQSTIGSAGAEVARVFAQAVEVTVHDPTTPIPSDIEHLVRRELDAADAVASADVVVVATPWPEYEEVGLMVALGSARLVIDPYGVISRTSAKSDLDNVVVRGRARSIPRD